MTAPTTKVSKPTPMGARLWASILLFGLIGQLSWVVENVYFSTFIQKQITTHAWATSATVAASAICAALATFLAGRYPTGSASVSPLCASAILPGA